jgi:signal transduction histidine kinase
MILAELLFPTLGGLRRIAAWQRSSAQSAKDGRVFMRLRLATKFSVVIVSVTVLAVATSVVAILDARRMGDLMQKSVVENVSSLYVVKSLEISLRDENAALSAYVMDDGNRQWLKDLQQARKRFDYWMIETRKTAFTPIEQQLLDGAEDVHRKYARLAEEVVEKYDAAGISPVRLIVLRDLTKLYRQAEGLCDQFADTNQHYVDADRVRAQEQVGRTTWVVTLLAGTTMACGALLAWLFSHNVLLPLRRMVADARSFTHRGAREGDDSPGDELRAIGAYLQILMSDVTDSRINAQESHEQFLNAEKLAAVGRLAAGVAHEIRNPLNSIRLWLFAIEKVMGSGAQMEHELHMIADEIERLERIVRHFLEFSRPPLLKPRAVCLPLLLTKTLDLFMLRAEEQRVRLHYEKTGDLPPVMGDMEQLQQVLLNLVGNALDATPEGGEVRIDTAMETDAASRTMVAVRIHDTGSGLPEEIRERIFEPFFTTKRDGTGLGLCISAQIVAGHGGRLAVASSSPSGTTFVLWIPATTAEPFLPPPV